MPALYFYLLLRVTIWAVWAAAVIPIPLPLLEKRLTAQSGICTNKGLQFITASSLSPSETFVSGSWSYLTVRGARRAPCSARVNFTPVRAESFLPFLYVYAFSV